MRAIIWLSKASASDKEWVVAYATDALTEAYARVGPAASSAASAATVGSQVVGRHDLVDQAESPAPRRP